MADNTDVGGDTRIGASSIPNPLLSCSMSFPEERSLEGGKKRQNRGMNTLSWNSLVEGLKEQIWRPANISPGGELVQRGHILHEGKELGQLGIIQLIIFKNKTKNHS